jgi:hypothetical protein
MLITDGHIDKSDRFRSGQMYLNAVIHFYGNNSGDSGTVQLLLRSQLKYCNHSSWMKELG